MLPISETNDARSASVLIIVLFYPLVEFRADTLFCVGTPMNAHVQIVKYSETAFAALHLDIRRENFDVLSTLWTFLDGEGWCT